MHDYGVCLAADGSEKNSPRRNSFPSGCCLLFLAAAGGSIVHCALLDFFDKLDYLVIIVLDILIKLSALFGAEL